MRAGRRLLPLVVLLGVLAATTAAALAGTVSWGSAIEVPGSAALNVGGNAGLYSVSCASAGNCAAGGSYVDGSGNRQALVVSEQGGVWGPAIEVPGTAALNVGGYASVESVSCAEAGDCAAGGGLWDPSTGQGEAFVVDEANGSWGTAIEVPGMAVLSVGDDAAVTSVSCASAGDCAASGYFALGFDHAGSPSHFEAFVVSEKNGKWGTAHPVPGRAASIHFYYSYVSSVSCAGAGDCVAGGFYIDRDGKAHAFVVAERNGTWGNGTKVPGTAALSLGALSVGGSAWVTSVSCASPGNCVAGGGYNYLCRSCRDRAFVVDEKNGKWGRAIGAIKVLGHSVQLGSVSCSSAGNCAAGGDYTDRAHKTQAFVVAERNGTWGTGTTVPGTAALNVGGNAWVASVSCASRGNCAASGYYTDGVHKAQAFVVAEQSGRWGRAVEVPGTAALDVGGGTAVAGSISCASAGSCAVGGSYTNSSGYRQAFVTAP